MKLQSLNTKAAVILFLLFSISAGLIAGYILSQDRRYDPNETIEARKERLWPRYHQLTWAAASQLKELLYEAEKGNVKAKIKIGDLYSIHQLSFIDSGAAAVDCFPGPCKRPISEILPIFFTYSSVKKDNNLALRWYLEAAESGVPAAQIRAGEFYSSQSWYRKHRDLIWDDALLHGEFDTQDNDAEAMKWYRMAAEQGDAIAQYRIADMYKDGTGTPQNFVEAYFWFSLAANRNKVAVSDRNKAAANLTANEVVEVKRRVIAWKPVEHR